MTRVRLFTSAVAILLISSPFGMLLQLPGAFGECPDVTPNNSPCETTITVCRPNSLGACPGEGTVVAWGDFHCEVMSEGSYCIGGDFAPCKWVGPCVSVGFRNCIPNPFLCQYYDAQTKVAAACPVK
jgi:hypothetical protein